ncbi:hypothetical protein [Conexibacter sp. CPCC 206217]|uniref:hypothetical protein n=1 Tax=Conexibacter sp. CPCC 206217 TaxID=3064574 RepID=UPI00271962CC|nr:hypothetical protein [Conexibacter sp. CPCC 206217]MDO8213474.1 hypothetical protein [Conexibacter sp. CPCC 206217]
MFFAGLVCGMVVTLFMVWLLPRLDAAGSVEPDPREDLRAVEEATIRKMLDVEREVRSAPADLSALQNHTWRWQP